MGYPDGMTRRDLIHVGELKDIEDDCDYFQKMFDHDWRCSDCGKGYDNDAGRPPRWPSKKKSHASCPDAGKVKICDSCGIMESADGFTQNPED